MTPYLILNLLFYGLMLVGTLLRYNSLKREDVPSAVETLVAAFFFLYTVFMLRHH